MGALEFVSSIKWPVTVLLLAGLATRALRRNPAARASIGYWLRSRNVRLRLFGQEIDTSVATTQGSMDVAAEDDLGLAVAVGGGSEGDPDSADVEIVRRAAVESVMRSAARLGWQLAQDGRQTPPELTVRWTEDGHPRLVMPGRAVPWFRLDRHSSATAQPPSGEQPPTLPGIAEWLVGHNEEVLEGQRALGREIMRRAFGR